MSTESTGGWIGVDLDGALAEYHGWDGGRIGAPIPAMLRRVKQWLAEGVEVRIVTARVNPAYVDWEDSERAIKQWCRTHLCGHALPVTCQKDMAMIELWDDRAVQVEPNTGKRIDGKE